MRDSILREVINIKPYDDLEYQHRKETIEWIESGAELFRTEKPATPPMHLVSYFVLIDDEYILLVQHRNACLWLPTGGHVEPNEHPWDTVRREAKEELGIEAVFLWETPLFITSTRTVGLTAGHTDVSLWYVLQGSRSGELHFDGNEFKSIRWFQRDEVPFEYSDPYMPRFIAKMVATTN